MLQFICRFMYNETDGSFSDIVNTLAMPSPPPDNCPNCLLTSQNADDLACISVKHGVSYLGTTYHPNDYALFKSEDGPAEIGRIKFIELPSTSSGETHISYHPLGHMHSGIEGAPTQLYDVVSIVTYGTYLRFRLFLLSLNSSLLKVTMGRRNLSQIFSPNVL